MKVNLSRRGVQFSVLSVYRRIRDRKPRIALSALALCKGLYGRERVRVVTPQRAKKFLTCLFFNRVEPLSEVRVRAGPTVVKISFRRAITSVEPSCLHFLMNIYPENLSIAKRINLYPLWGGTEK